MLNGNDHDLTTSCEDDLRETLPPPFFHSTVWRAYEDDYPELASWDTSRPMTLPSHS